MPGRPAGCVLAHLTTIHIATVQISNNNAGIWKRQTRNADRASALAGFDGHRRRPIRYTLYATIPKRTSSEMAENRNVPNGRIDELVVASMATTRNDEMVAMRESTAARSPKP